MSKLSKILKITFWTSILTMTFGNIATIWGALWGDQVFDSGGILFWVSLVFLLITTWAERSRVS